MGVRLIKFIDRFVGAPFCVFLFIIRLHKKRSIPKEIKKILVVQLWGIGETILTIPAVKALKKKYGSVDVLCTERNKDVYSGYPFGLKVVKLNPFSLKLFILRNWRKYDVVIDMEEYLNISALVSFFVGKYSVGYSHGIRSSLYSAKVKYNDQQHASSTFFDLVKALGIKGSVEKLERLNFTKSDQRVVDLALSNSSVKDNDFIVGIAAGAAESSKSRMWPKERFAGLIDEICTKHGNAKFVLIGAGYEKSLNDSIIRLVKNRNKVFNFAGKFTLKQTFCMISKCSVFIGNDSGPMHIAAAMDVKTIGLFGPNLPVRFAPLNRKSVSLYKKFECSPCINVHKGRVPECVYRKDNENYQKCMKEIKVKEVLKYV